MQDLSLNVLDIVQNSIKANASLIEIIIEKNNPKNQLCITIIDNGCGMEQEQIQKIIDPFYTTRTTRKVGLGVPFFKMSAEMTGGEFSISSSVGIGTKIQAIYNQNHLDMMPLGDIPETIACLIQLNPSIDFVYKYILDLNEYLLDTRQIKSVLEDVSIDSFEVIEFIKQNIKDGQDELENF